LPQLVRLSHHLVTGLLKCRREILIGYRRQRPADAILNLVDGHSVRQAGLDDADSGLHLGFGHFAGNAISRRKRNFTAKDPRQHSAGPPVVSPRKTRIS